MTNTNVKATIVIGNKTVTFEGPRDFVEAQVAIYSQPIPSAPSAKDNTDKEDHAAVSEKQIIEQKRPRNHPETVAVLAFSLAQGGTDHFTEDDIRRAYIRAGIKPPKVVAQAIRDAKNNFDYIEAGREKGTYKLTPHGDRTVRFDLPARE